MNRQQRKTKRAESAQLQWLEVPLNNRAQVAIGDTVYALTFIWNPTGLQLILEPQRSEDTRQYHLTRTGRDGAWQCDCPSANYRRVADCKHVAGMRALLAQLVEEYKPTEEPTKGGGNVNY